MDGTSTFGLGTSPLHAMRLRPSPRPYRLLTWSVVFAAAILLHALPASATDEIQVYTSDINDPGQWSLQLHNNYTVQGHKTPDFPVGFASNQALQGTPELAYGMTDWWELGAYAPYAYLPDGEYVSGGFKLRALFVAPHAKDREWVYGVNFEWSNEPSRWAPERYNLEVRPIIGIRKAPFEVIFNPILDFALSGSDHRGEFEPALRVAYTLNDLWQVGVEHYSDLGFLDSGYSSSQQAQNTYAVVDYNGPVSVEFGVGHGWTPGSDETVVKSIVGFAW